MHIAIAGNIGSGKTTLTTMLSQHYGWEARFECVSENPYLQDFYADTKRWSFNLEVFFLKERFRDALDIARLSAGQGHGVIQDRTIYEGVHVFAENDYRQGLIERRDYETFMELFAQMQDQVRLPDLMVYLRSDISHLVENIQKRGRDYEQTIQIEYLQGLNELYEEFVASKYPGRILTVDVDDLDYLHNPLDLRSIIERIDTELFGLFRTVKK